MQINAISIYSTIRNVTIVLAQFMIVSAFVLSLIGCGADGGSGPINSTAATDAEGNPEVSTDTGSEPGDADQFADLPLPDGEENPTDTGASAPTGVAARLTWDASTDPDVTNYYVYYGKQSSGAPGSCSYEASQAVEAPPATITGLDPNTPYFFAISAFGDSESPCSNEMLVVTPPAQG